jgi:hypothetical protein
MARWRASPDLVPIMILSHRHKLIFIKVSKTASSSIELALEPICGPEDIVSTQQKHPGGANPWPDEQGYKPRNYRGLFLPKLNSERPLHQLRNDIRDLIERRKFYNHMSAFEIRARAGRQIFDSYFKFCFERNPWDKAVSFFFWVKARHEVPYDFETFTQIRKLPSRFDLYTLNGKLAVDFVGNYETLEADFGRALRQAGIAEPPPLPRAKAKFRPPGHYRDYYTDVSRRAVAKQFEREIEMFRYTF